MKCKAFPSLLATLLWAGSAFSSAFAAHPSSADFAFGLVLKPEGPGAVYQVTPPEAVYRRVTRPDLGDIRVFNANGEPVPHALRRPDPAEAGEEPPWISLPFFPLFQAPSEEGGDVWLQIITDDTGAILRTRPKNRDEADIPGAYLVDAGKLAEPPNALRLDWTQSGDSLVARVSVSAGRDLNEWVTLVPSTTLVRLRYGEHRLSRQTIQLPRPQARYLRISWPEAARSARITAVEARGLSKSGRSARLYVQISGHSAEGEKPAFEFDAGGRFPADEVTVLLTEPNSLIQGALFSRPREEAEWRFRARGLFHHLVVEDTELVGDPVSISMVSDRYWRLEIESEDAGLGGSPPVLELGYIPHELLFLARGAGPFTLAFGSYQAEPAAAPANPLLQMVNRKDRGGLIRRASTGEMIPLAGADGLIPPPPPIPWKRYLLWAVLILGVAAVGWMAWGVYRQMQSSSNEDSEASE
ncbi:MAG: DUF3999 domain-containing protein [Thermodesulfobacteriota bacterium]